MSETTKQRKALEKQATAKATELGHRLSDFATCYGDRTKAYSEAYCLNGDGDCLAVAVVNIKSPQGKQIGGLATILRCEQQPPSSTRGVRGGGDASNL